MVLCICGDELSSEVQKRSVCNFPDVPLKNKVNEVVLCACVPYIKFSAGYMVGLMISEVYSNQNNSLKIPFIIPMCLLNYLDSFFWK